MRERDAAQRLSDAEREEREARRTFRSELAKPILSMLDEVSLVQRKKSMANTLVQAVAENKDNAVSELAKKHGATVEEALKPFQEDASKITHEEFMATMQRRLPEISRVSDETLRTLLVEILLMPLETRKLQEVAGRLSCRTELGRGRLGPLRRHR